MRTRSRAAGRAKLVGEGREHPMRAVAGHSGARRYMRSVNSRAWATSQPLRVSHGSRIGRWDCPCEVAYSSVNVADVEYGRDKPKYTFSWSGRPTHAQRERLRSPKPARERQCEGNPSVLAAFGCRLARSTHLAGYTPRLASDEELLALTDRQLRAAISLAGLSDEDCSTKRSWSLVSARPTQCSLNESPNGTRKSERAPCSRPNRATVLGSDVAGIVVAVSPSCSGRLKIGDTCGATRRE